MTTKFGRTTPSQMSMLLLAGIDYSISLVDMELLDEEKMNMMTSGRKLLQKMTGEDFGFDLTNWRNFFINNDENDEYGYKHPYAFEDVDEAIRQAILDPHRRQIIAKREKRAHELLDLLLKNPQISFSSKLRIEIPESGGVYRIIENGSSGERTVLVGYSKNIRSSLMGNSIKSMLQRVARDGIDSYALQVVLLSETEMVWFAQFAIDELKPLFHESITA